MNFPTENEIRTACLEAKLQGYEIVAGYADINNRKLCALAAYTLKDMGWNHTEEKFFSIPNYGTDIERFAFFIGFDENLPIEPANISEIGRKLRKEFIN